MQITALNENLATLKKEWQSSQRRVSELEKQTDDLRGEIAVLEATVQNNQDERRALLERWVLFTLPGEPIHHTLSADTLWGIFIKNLLGPSSHKCLF